MIYGMGCDISKVERIESVFGKAGRLERCFTIREIAWVAGRAERVAGYFCAKEAVAKAFGTGFRGFSLKDVEILRDDLGRPFLAPGSLAQITRRLGLSGGFSAHLSISHEREYAVATCIIETDGL